MTRLCSSKIVPHLHTAHEKQSSSSRRKRRSSSPQICVGGHRSGEMNSSVFFWIRPNSPYCQILTRLTTNFGTDARACVQDKRRRRWSSVSLTRGQPYHKTSSTTLCTIQKATVSVHEGQETLLWKWTPVLLH